jgi:hypothetical protein
MLQMQYADHLFPADSESRAGGDGCGCSQTQSRHCCERLFAYEVADGEKRDDSFLPGWRNHRDLCATILEVKDRVRGVSLRKKAFFGSNLMILLPTPALVRKVVTSNRGFSSSTIEGLLTVAAREG